MSNVNNSKRVKLSSVESCIKPEDEDEAFVVEQKQPIAGCSGSSNQKTPKDASETATASTTATSDTVKGSALIEDVLMLIFEADFLDTADLLQFRLVNRCWRDSATSVLLRSSACQISFNLCVVPDPSTAKLEAQKSVYCNNSDHSALLEDLNEIISKSPKFPCSNFRFVNSYSFGDDHHENKIDTSSLLKFFSAYGNNVKTITVGDLILGQDLHCLLVDHAPNLECLDLRYLKTFGDGDPTEIQEPLFAESVILPNLKTLVLGTCTDFNLLELVDAAINLESVETTRVEDLKLLLEHGKVGLIKKLEYGLMVHNLEEVSVYEKLAESQPKLTKLIIIAVRLASVKRSGRGLRSHILKMQMFLNRILESSKDTLKYLEYRVSPFADIKFPILPNLECLNILVRIQARYLTESRSAYPKLQFENADEDHFAARRGDPDFECPNEINSRIYGLCPNQPCDTFPNLQKLQLDINHYYDFERDGTVRLLHTCQSQNQKIMPHFYRTVKVLEINCALPITILRAQSFSNLFRNVTILKLKCGEVTELNSSLWVLSPLAKSIEIYGLHNSDVYYNEWEGEYSCNDKYDVVDEVSLVDSLFTGFSIEMCTKLRRVKQFPVDIEGNPSLMKFMRVKPSICDLDDLTDFKILFSELSSTFASRVSGFYAFRNMPRTSITFAHLAPIKCKEAECESEKYLTPISSFIHFTHRNLPKRFSDENDDDANY